MELRLFGLAASTGPGACLFFLFLTIALLNGTRWHFTVLLIFISLMISDNEHFQSQQKQLLSPCLSSFTCENENASSIF